MSGTIEDVTKFLLDGKDTSKDVSEEETTDDDVTDDDQEDTDDDQDDQEDTDEDQDEDTDDDQDEDADEDEEPDSGAETTLDVSDDDTIEVKVDGEVVTVTLGELKNQYAGEGAIRKRLQEATETKKAAATERQKVTSESHQVQAALYSVIEQLDGMLSTPSIRPPDDSLKHSDPRAYLNHLERYQEEVQAIETSRTKLVEVFKDANKKLEEFKDNARKEQIELLNATLEPLRNEKTRKQAAQDILDAVGVYGFEEKDLKEVVDHRVYRMAYDAMQYRKLLAGGKTQLGELQKKAQKKRPARTLRTAASRKTRAVSETKKAAKIRNRAKKSGTVDDVAAMLVHNAKSRRQNRR